MWAQVDETLEQDSAYRAIFEASSDGLVINDPETGVVLEANPAFCQMHGYDRMVGLHPTTFIHPNSFPLFDQYVQAIRGGREFRTRAQDIRSDGTVFHVEVLGRGFQYQGRFAMLGVVRDVTEQVRGEHILEERVAARTREIERRREVAEGLRDLLATINSTLTLEEILAEVLAQAGRLLECQASAIYVPDSSRVSNRLRVAASMQLDEGYVAAGAVAGVPVTGLAFSARRPVAVYDVAAALYHAGDEIADVELEDRGTHVLATRIECEVADQSGGEPFGGHRAVLAVPLAAKDTAYGCLTLLYRHPREFSDEEVWLARAFADQAALAIENAQLHAQSEQRLHEQDALYRADQQMHSSLKLELVLQALCDLAVDILQADKTAVWTWDEQRQGLAVAAAHGVSDEFRAQSFTRDEPALREFESGDVTVVEDTRAAAHLNPGFRAAVDQEGVRSWISAAIRIGGQVFGSFAVAYASPRQFGDREHRLVLALAQRAALAIENARLYQQAERQLREIEALYRADEALHRSLNLDDVLETLVKEATDVLGATKSLVMIWDAAHMRLVVGAAHGFSAAIRGYSATPDEAPIMPEALNADVVSIEDVRSDTRLSSAQRALAEWEGVISSLNGAIRIGGEVFGAFSVNFAEPHRASTEEKRLLVALTGRAALAIQNARLHEQSEQRRVELQALYEADEALHRSLRLNDVLEALVNAAIGLLHVDFAGVWGPDPENSGRTIPLASYGISDEYLQLSIRLQDEPGVVEYWSAREPLSVADITDDPRLPALQRAAIEREGCRAMLNIIVPIDDGGFGSFTVGRRTPRPFSEPEQRLLLALGQRAALAIRNARLFEQAQQAATLEERQRLARELHDAVTQTLFSTALISEVLPDLWEMAPDEGRQQLAELRRLTRGALAEMRTLLVELRPGALIELGLPDLLRQLVEATEGRSRLQVSTQITGSCGALPAEVQVALYRLLQEALNNVVKHAHARYVSVDLDYLVDGGVRISVVDDGCGFDPDAVPAGHLGLGIMRERAEAIGACLQLQSRPGDGTSITIEWRQEDPPSA